MIATHVYKYVGLQSSSAFVSSFSCLFVYMNQRMKHKDDKSCVRVYGHGGTVIIYIHTPFANLLVLISCFMWYERIRLHVTIMQNDTNVPHYRISLSVRMKLKLDALILITHVYSR